MLIVWSYGFICLLLFIGFFYILNCISLHRILRHKNAVISFARRWVNSKTNGIMNADVLFLAIISSYTGAAW